MLAELLTITCVIGIPPISPEMIFPIPWAFNSRLVGVTFFSGSNLSVASTHNNVSKLATIAITTASFGSKTHQGEVVYLKPKRRRGSCLVQLVETSSRVINSNYSTQSAMNRLVSRVPPLYRLLEKTN